MSRRSGHCLDGLHECCKYAPCDCTCHDAADEVRGDYAAEDETDLRTYGVEL